MGDFNTPLTPMDRSTKQKINMETQTLNDTIDQLNLIDIYRTFHPKTMNFTFFSGANGTFSRIDLILGHKFSPGKLKNIEIIPSIFSDHKAVRLDLNCLFNLYAEYIMRNAGLEEAQGGIKIAERNINNLRYADDITLMAESEEELKRLLMKVKVESEKVGLKLNIQKTKIIASGPITSWEIDGETVSDFIFWAPKSLQMVTAAMKLKDAYSLEGKL